MGNITIGGSKKLQISPSSNKKLSFAEPMSLNFTVTNGVWVFNLENPTPEIQNYITNSNYTIRLQLIRYGVGKRPSISSITRENYPNSISNKDLYIKPNYPSYINSTGYLSPSKIIASVNINSYKASNLQNIDVSSWANTIMRYAGTTSSIINKGLVKAAYYGLGYYFMNYAFCLSIDNKFFAVTKIINARYSYLDSSSPAISTNYTLTNDVLNINEI